MESVSIIRHLPKMLYEIVAQFSKAEQTILEALTKKQRSQLIEQSGLSDADLTFIEAASGRENSGRGEGLFLVLRNQMPTLGLKPETLIKTFNWLRVHGGASAANYATKITNLYGRTNSGRFRRQNRTRSERYPIKRAGVAYGFSQSAYRLG